MVFGLSNTSKLRSASHAGDWYTEDKQELDAQLTDWLKIVNPKDITYPIKGCKAVIAPHAGYAYSGPSAAWAYKSIDTSNMFVTPCYDNLASELTTDNKRVFILGPSHHLYLDSCALSACEDYETPIGNLPLDVDLIKELKATGEFETLSLKSDEAEHSIEMHLPYVRKIFEGVDIKIIPIVVGAISQKDEKAYGSLLAPYLAKDDTFCVVSSDFCHWGARFQYTYYYPEPAPSDIPAMRLSNGVPPSSEHAIHESISRLDHEAMDILNLPPSTASEAHNAFAAYLAKTRNTICGRHPIGVLLGALSQIEMNTDAKPTMKWVHYKQSSACTTIRDSSVSYASAWIKFQ